MFVNLKSETYLLLNNKYVKSNNSIRVYGGVYLKLRNCLLCILKEYGVNNYNSFFALVKAVSPYQDDVEIYRFWNGYFPSEFFIDFVNELVTVIKYVNLKPFQNGPIN